MRKFKNKIIYLYEKFEEKRCYKCPAHYCNYTGEDYDDGCEIFSQYGEKHCFFALLPFCTVNTILKSKRKKEEKYWINEGKKYGI